jgi:hypothetical protein
MTTSKNSLDIILLFFSLNYYSLRKESQNLVTTNSRATTLPSESKSSSYSGAEDLSPTEL